ncbi:bifunctional tetrahydrofolate synthase/dihydrofolate synthase [Gordonia iterans]
MTPSDPFDELKGLGDELKGLGDELKGLGDELKGLGDESEGLGDELKGLGDEPEGLEDESEGLGDESEGLGDEPEGLGDELTGQQDDLAELAAVEADLDTRWPETKIEPSLTRISALMELLGNPQHAYPSIHVAGTNGKTSVTRMIDSLLRAFHRRTGRITSPHLQLVTERIAIDGHPISPRTYVDAYRDIEPYLTMVDDSSETAGGPRMSKFEVLTAMAYAAFAEAPIEVAVVETGMGGRWDATNVIDSKVAVITPIAFDHADYLGDTLAAIAGEKAGIITRTDTDVLVPDDAVTVIGVQRPEAMDVLLREAVAAESVVARQNSEFAVLESATAVGGQLLRIQGLGGVYEDVFLPLHGAHQAENAALALAAVEAFFGAGPDRQLDADLVRAGFAEVASPGRLERVRSAPTVFVDAAHNPHGGRALAQTLTEEFAFRRLIGVVGMLGDKDARGFLDALEPVLDAVVITDNGSPRAVDPQALGELAVELFGEDRVQIEPFLPDAVAAAIALAEEDDDETLSGAGVVITGSVVTAGAGRTLFGKEPS